jgi:membrane fusion protein (multidrug efflux system)
VADDARPLDQKTLPGVLSEAPPEAAKTRPSRKQMFTWLATGVAAIVVLIGLQWVLFGSHLVSTEDAYVNAATARLSSQVSGVIAEAPVVDTTSVKKGDILAVIDPADAKIAVARAEAEYRRALLRARSYHAEQGVAVAQVYARRADLEKANTDYERRAALSKTGAVSGEELSSARAARDAARANLAAALENAAGQRVLTAGVAPAKHPEVLAAKAAWDAAKLDLERTIIRAPFDGVVVANAIQVGQRVAPGTPLASVVQVLDAHVDANFKESQLRKVRIGQPVELTADIYGGGVKYHGKVVGIGAGTGSAFAVIPAQNATGNWIKVIQRVPVRIALDSKEVSEHPLRVGMSMHATIDIASKG